MPGINALLSLISYDNAFQRVQAASAEDVARRLGVTLVIVYAGGDAIYQVQQNDETAMVARRAFSEIADFAERKSWLDKPLLGCDGLPEAASNTCVQVT
jgi:sugar phosphate isomerase/epimerase